MKGIFGSMLDLNHDGNISPLESVMEFTFLNELLKDDSDVQTELELSGLDPDELEFMDVDERRKALEDAGLDPDEYDFSGRSIYNGKSIYHTDRNKTLFRK